MPTRVKITINDDSASQVALCRYALRLAAHIMETAGYNDPHNPAITAGFAVNRQWQAGAARMHDVRQAGFAVHKLARQAPATCRSTLWWLGTTPSRSSTCSTPAIEPPLPTSASGRCR